MVYVTISKTLDELIKQDGRLVLPLIIIIIIIIKYRRDFDVMLILNLFSVHMRVCPCVYVGVWTNVCMSVYESETYSIHRTLFTTYSVRRTLYVIDSELACTCVRGQTVNRELWRYYIAALRGIWQSPERLMSHEINTHSPCLNITSRNRAHPPRDHQRHACSRITWLKSCYIT